MDLSFLRLLAIVPALATSLVAYSQPGGKSLDDIRKHQFAQFDTDGDSNISRDEFYDWYIQRLDSQFIRLDSDKNGYLSDDEFLNRTGRGGPQGYKSHELPLRQPVK